MPSGTLEAAMRWEISRQLQKSGQLENLTAPDSVELIEDALAEMGRKIVRLQMSGDFSVLEALAMDYQRGLFDR